jgi:hypothetical protein
LSWLSKSTGLFSANRVYTSAPDSMHSAEGANREASQDWVRSYRCPTCRGEGAQGTHTQHQASRPAGALTAAQHPY